MVNKVRGRIVTCPGDDCKGTHCRRKGLVPAKKKPKQRYVCFDCGRSFYLPPEPKKKVGKVRE